MNSVRRKRRRRYFVVFVVAMIVLVVGCNTRSGYHVWDNEVWSGSNQGTFDRNISGDDDALNGAETNKDGKGEPADTLNESDGSKPDGEEDDKSNQGGKPDGKDDNHSNQGGKPGGEVAPGQEGKPTKPTKPTSSVVLDKVTSPVVDYIAAPDAKLVALTFDDGPDKNYTMDVLDILRKNKLKATFFTVGIQVKKYPEIMKLIAQDGHAIGNHSYHHPNLSKLDSKTIKEEIKWTDYLIEESVGYVPRLVRAPYGALSPLVRSIMKDNNRELVGWTVDTRDWAGESVANMRANVNKNTKPGGIILMHSFGSKHLKNTVELLPLIIEDLSKKGYTFVTVDELLSANEQRAAAENK